MRPTGPSQVPVTDLLFLCLAEQAHGYPCSNHRALRVKARPWGRSKPANPPAGSPAEAQQRLSAGQPALLK